MTDKFNSLTIFEIKEVITLDNSKAESRKSRIQVLLESEKVELFKTDDEGNVILDKNNHEHKEWMDE
jgi:hypothetical protein